MKRPLVFVGSRTAMPELATIAELNNIEILGILDSHYYGNTDSINNVPVIGNESWLLQNHAEADRLRRTCDFFPANITDGSTRPFDSNNPQLGTLTDLRKQRIDLLDQSGVNVINLIHPAANIPSKNSRYAKYSIGKGVLIYPNVYHSPDRLTVGDYCIFSWGSACGCDVTIGRNVLMMPEAKAMHTVLEDDVLVGMFSKFDAFKNKGMIRVGKNTVIWAGATVTSDLPENCKYTHKGEIIPKK